MIAACLFLATKVCESKVRGRAVGGRAIHEQFLVVAHKKPYDPKVCFLPPFRRPPSPFLSLPCLQTCKMLNVLLMLRRALTSSNISTLNGN